MSRQSPDASDPLQALQKKLDRKKKDVNFPRQTAVGMATRLGAEFTSGVLVGAATGWYLDEWLDTKPWLLCVCLLLGTAAGVNLMMQTLKQYDKQQRSSENSEADSES